MVVSIGALLGLFGAAAPGAHAFALDESTCDAYASTTGDDASGDGSFSAPYRTAQKLVDRLSGSLSANKGCLLPGVYDENLVVRSSGTKDSFLFLESACCSAKDRATLRGSVVVDQSASHVAITNLNLEGSGSGPAVTVNGDSTFIGRNNISAPAGGSCVDVGRGRSVTSVSVSGNLVHNCGAAGQPAIWEEHASSGRVSRNYIYANPGPGLVVGPDVHNGRLSRNLLDGNAQGVRFSGNSTQASSDLTFVENIVSNSQGYNVAHDYPGPAGTGNSITANCLDKAGGGIQPGQPDVASDNVFASPAYQDRGSPPGGFAIPVGTPCRVHGPLAEPVAVTSTTFFDPLLPVEDETVFRTSVETTWQFATIHFEWAPGPNAPLPFPFATPETPVIGGQFDDPGRRYIATQSVSTLEPSHTYTVRAIVTGDFGRIRTPQVDVTLPPPIPLRPSYRVQLAQDGVAKRRSTKVLEIRVTGAPVGAVVVASCGSHRLGCPARPTRYKVRRGHPLRFFAGRRFAAGATLTIAVSPPPVDTSTPASGTVETPAERGTRLARRFTRETRTTYHFRRSRPPTRSELCLSTIRKQYPCLQIGASTFGPTVRFVRVRGVPPKASVRYICHGSGCPRRGRTITTAAAGSVEFREFRSRKLKPGALLEILVTRPKTIGSVALIHLRARTSTRRDGCTTVGQGTSFVPVRRCPFG